VQFSCAFPNRILLTGKISVSVYTKCKCTSFLAEAIYTKSAHHYLVEPDQITKEILLVTEHCLLLPFPFANQLREALIYRAPIMQNLLLHGV